MINTILLKNQTMFVGAIAVNNNPYGFHINVADSCKII